MGTLLPATLSVFLLLAAPALAASSDLDELLLRNAIPQTRQAPLRSDLALLEAIKAAEAAGALDYLGKGRARLPEVYWRNDGNGGRVLTLQGFQIYRDRLTKEALSYFTSRGVPMSGIYKVTGPDGESIMGEFGLLSYRGMDIYRSALRGKKEWYAPGETPPLIAAEEARVSGLLRSGYTELSAPEYSWLRQVTRCSETTLKRSFGVVTLERKGVVARHFLRVHGENSSAVIYSYVYRYRHGETGLAGNGSTAFFGTGGGEKKRLCGPDGDPWHGD